jgi:hypothetical protein
VSFTAEGLVAIYRIFDNELEMVNNPSVVHAWATLPLAAYSEVVNRFISQQHWSGNDLRDREKVLICTE